MSMHNSKGPSQRYEPYGSSRSASCGYCAILGSGSRAAANKKPHGRAKTLGTAGPNPRRVHQGSMPNDSIRFHIQSLNSAASTHHSPATVGARRAPSVAPPSASTHPDRPTGIGIGSPASPVGESVALVWRGRDIAADTSSTQSETAMPRFSANRIVPAFGDERLLDCTQPQESLALVNVHRKRLDVQRPIGIGVAPR